MLNDHTLLLPVSHAMRRLLQTRKLHWRVKFRQATWPCNTGGGGVLRLIFAWYVPLASQSTYTIIVYSVAHYRPHLSHFWANM